MCLTQTLACKELTGVSVQPHLFEVVPTMHARKQRMADLATNGFIVLPGGYVR